MRKSGRTSRKAHRCGGREEMSVLSRKFNRKEWVTKVICLGLRGMRCLGEDVGPRAGLPETCKGREGAVISSLGLDQAYPGHRASVTRGNWVLWLWLPIWSGL